MLLKTLFNLITIVAKIYYEEKKEFRSAQIQQIIFYGNVIANIATLRYQFLTILSGISIAIIGIIIGNQVTQSSPLILISLILSFLVFSVSSIVYLKHSRKDMKYIQAVQKEIPKLRPAQKLQTPQPKLINYWPEILLSLQILSIILFILDHYQ